MILPKTGRVYQSKSETVSDFVLWTTATAMGSCVWSGVVVVGDPAPASLAARFQSPQLGWGCLSALARWDLQDIAGQGLGSFEHRVMVGAVSRVDQRRNSEALLSTTQAMAVSTSEKMPTLVYTRGANRERLSLVAAKHTPGEHEFPHLVGNLPAPRK